MSKLKILITGGNGFIAKFLSTNLNYQIVSPPRAELDLLNLEQVTDWFNNNEVDVVIHCALTGREVLFSTEPTYLSDGLLMFRNLWLQKEKFKRLINLGTAYELDLTQDHNLVTEHDFLNYLPTTSYGYAKNLTARIIQDTANFYNLKLFGVFHETESHQRFLQRVKHDAEVVIKNDIYLDYIYLPDILPMIETIVNGYSQHRDINMVYPNKYRLSQLAYTLCAHLDLPSDKIKVLNSSGNNLTGNSSVLDSYKFDLIGIDQGLRNYK